MPAFKRKREEDDDSSEEPAYGKQILPVANLPEDFDEDPTDGMQYLFMVRRAARQLPNTVRAPNPYEKPEPETHVINVNYEIQSSSVQSQLPSIEWRTVFEQRFQNFRKNLDQPTVHIGPTSPPQLNLMPDQKDRDSWWSFLAGQPEADWNTSKRSKSKFKKGKQLPPGMRGWTGEYSQRGAPVLVQNSLNNDEGGIEGKSETNPADTLPSPVSTPVSLEYLEAMIQPSSTLRNTPDDGLFVPREPTTRMLKLIDERTALHLLKYFTHWINAHLNSQESSAHIATDSHARWMFCLLSRIDHFISPDDMNLLRSLARACISLLKHIKKQAMQEEISEISDVSGSKLMSESACWVIISTVAERWKQRDLWMDAEDALKTCKA